MNERGGKHTAGKHQPAQCTERASHYRFRKVDERGRGPDPVEDAGAKGRVPHVRLDQGRASASPTRVGKQRPGEIKPHNPIALSSKMPDILAGSAAQIQNGRSPSTCPQVVPEQCRLTIGTPSPPAEIRLRLCRIRPGCPRGGLTPEAGSLGDGAASCSA